MGFIKVLLGFWAGWIALRIVRGVVAAQLAKRQGETPINKQGNAATLELMACPYCGVYTTAPCTNPDCPGKR